MDKEYFNIEIKIIKQIAKNNGYYNNGIIMIEVIDKLLKKHKNKKITHVIIKFIKINTLAQNIRQNYQVL